MRHDLEPFQSFVKLQASFDVVGDARREVTRDL